MKDILKKLVCSFDDELGLSQQTYEATQELISHILGEDAAGVFSRYVDAADGRFYLKQNTAPECWEEMLKNDPFNDDNTWVELWINRDDLSSDHYWLGQVLNGESMTIGKILSEAGEEYKVDRDDLVSALTYLHDQGYLGIVDPPTSIELDDGGVVEFDEDDGSIRYTDQYGNSEGKWEPGDAEYDHYKSIYFPDCHADCHAVDLDDVWGDEEE